MGDDEAKETSGVGAQSKDISRRKFIAEGVIGGGAVLGAATAAVYVVPALAGGSEKKVRVAMNDGAAPYVAPTLTPLNTDEDGARVIASASGWLPYTEPPDWLPFTL